MAANSYNNPYLYKASSEGALWIAIYRNVFVFSDVSVRFGNVVISVTNSPLLLF
jgi:hypothetical protein